MYLLTNNMGTNIRNVKCGVMKSNIFSDVTLSHEFSSKSFSNVFIKKHLMHQNGNSNHGVINFNFLLRCYILTRAQVRYKALHVVFIKE